MSTFVLVHAAAFAGWSWFKIVPRLERHGHRVIARDLPGHGRDRTQLSEITFECLVDSVCAIVDEQAESVILVGHSWGGGIITQAAEHRSDRIDAVVYLTGVLPRCGQSMMDCLTLPEGEGSLASRALEPSADQSYLSLRLEFVRENDCADCSDEDWALPRTPDAADSNRALLFSDGHDRRQVRADAQGVYRVSAGPRAPLPLQRRLHREAGIETVLSLDTSHCPNFSAPDELADALARAATIS